MDKKKLSRRKQREFAFQVLYSLNFHPEEDLELIKQDSAHFPDSKKINFGPEVAPFSWELIEGVVQKKSELDKYIEKYSRNWKINRIAKIELTILRLATFELIFRPDIPPKVSINEAIELAKSFGDVNSKVFVNGILDALAKDINNGQLRHSK